MASEFGGIAVEELRENNSEITGVVGLQHTSVTQDSSCVLLSVTEIDNEDQQACLNNLKSRIRRTKPDPSKWEKNIRIQNRMIGKEYEIVKKGVTENNTIIQKIVKPARQLGNSCDSEYCKKRNNCTKFKESERRAIFDSFWSKSWDAKKVFVLSHVDILEPTSRRQATSLSKENTMKYYLKLGKIKVLVCQKFFTSTLGLKNSQLYNWIHPKPKVQQQPDDVHEKTNNRVEFLTNFFTRLPKVPSHYCRKDSTKSYLDHTVLSKTDLFESYKAESEKDGVRPLSRTVFDRGFKEQNLGLFKPKSDQCDTCTMYEHKQVTEIIYENHIMRKDEARAEKDQNKEEALNGKCHTLTVDLQQVKLSPCVLASKNYFKQKISSHNYTVYNLKTRQTKCYWFDETHAELTGSTFASCIIDYLTENCLTPELLPINIFSDGCPSQNRNVILSNALLHFSVQHNIIVFQKILEKGHTQMEVDSVHSSIESRLKRQNIYLPSDYVQKTLEARKNPFPYEAKELTHDFFLNYADETTYKYKDIRPGQKAGDPVVVDIRVLKYTPEGKIYYKLEYSEEFIELPNANKKFSSFASSFPQLYSERLKITDDKYKDLQDLKSVLPPQFHSYYDDLPFGKIPKKKQSKGL